MPDGRHELEAHQERCWKNREQVKHDAGLERVSKIVVTFSRRCSRHAGSTGTAEDAVETEIFETGKSEAEEVAD